MITKPPEADSRVSKRPVLPDVVLEHVEEYAFLSIQRRKLLFSDEITLDQLREHDERIAAHWDGLVLAVPHSVELAVGRLEEGDPWDAFAAALRSGCSRAASPGSHMGRASEYRSDHDLPSPCE